MSFPLATAMMPALWAAATATNFSVTIATHSAAPAGHLGGIRAFVAEGATVITDNKNKDFYRDEVLVPQPRSLSPDRLSQFPFAPTGPGTLSLQTFTDRYTVGDATRTIELYHVEGLPHASDMLVAYLPQSKILVNADLYSPPPQGGNLPAVNANAVAVFNNVRRLKLDVAQHVPIHGNPGPDERVNKFQGRAAGGGAAHGAGIVGELGAALATKRPALALRLFALARLEGRKRQFRSGGNHIGLKLGKLKEQMRRLEVLKVEMLATPDQQESSARDSDGLRTNSKVFQKLPPRPF
jgi:glyoxylase-like metal-dependent hydrolase (beta-lactamase superfamily II)